MNEKKKINIKMIGLVILGTMIILLLVSRTIYSHYMPEVTATAPFNGKLTKTEKSKGFADWAEIVDVYADVGGKVEEVYVKEGDQVEEGQELFSLSFDKDQILQSLKELEVSRGKKSTEISRLQLQIETNNRHISELRNEEYLTDFISDFEIRKLQSEIEIAEEDLAKLKVLYEAGAATKNEYDTAQNNLKTMKDEKADLEKTYAESQNDQNKSKEDKEKERRKQILDYAAETEELRKEIAQNQLDLQTLSIEQETYQNTLNKFSSNAIVYAGGSGELTQFLINKGQQIDDGYYVGEIGCGNTYEIDCNLSLDNNFVVSGDSCKLKNTNHSFDGTVSKITLTEAAKRVTISIQSDDISSGETFDVTFEKKSTESYTLVPNGALNMDNDGYYLYQLKRRDGMLGQEYYAQKLRVYIGDNDDENTAITKGLSFLEPVVLTSDKAFSEGQSLNLTNVGDFFEN